MTDPQTLRALATELCEAKEGSRDLDLRISKTINYRDAFSNYGWEWSIFNDELKAAGRALDPAQFVPDWTTSLDAALPGEDFNAVYAPLYGHRRTEADEDKYMVVNEHGTTACANTEPLARRAAALLAMADRMERDQ